MGAFISYRSTDAAIANEIREAIQRKGGTQSVWMAPWDIPFGQDYSQCIPDALQACDRVILVLSRAANQSDYVRKEIDRAVKYRKKILPVLIENFEPRGGLEYLIAGYQRIPATEQDSAVWMSAVIEAALAPLDADIQLKPKRHNEFIHIDATKIAFGAATLATVVSLVLHGAPLEGLPVSPLFMTVRDATPSPYVMLALLALMASGMWLAQKINARGMRSFVIRSSDLVMMTGLLLGGMLLAIFFLFTPLVAAVLVALLYLPTRRMFLKRWAVFAVIMAALVGLSAWWVEGNLYRMAFDKGPVVAVIPVCQGGECEWDRGAASYQSIIEGIAGVLEGDTSVMMPSREAALQFYDSRKAFEDHSRFANWLALLTHGRTFDRLVEITLQPGCSTTPGAESYRLTASAFTLQERSPPFWSDWKVGRQLSFDNVLRFEGEAPKDTRMASLLLGGLIIEYVLGIDSDSGKALFTDQERLELSQRFLRTANETSLRSHLPEAARAATEAGASSASLDEVRGAFRTVLIELRKAAAPAEVEHSSVCHQASDDAIVQLRIRNNLNAAATAPVAPPGGGDQ